MNYIKRYSEREDYLYDYWVDEMGVQDTSLSLNDSGMELLTIKLEELFDLFCLSRFDTDEMENDFCDIRNDLIDIFNKGKEVHNE